MIKTLVVAAALTVGLAGTQSHSKRRLRRLRIIGLPIIRCADCLLVIRSVTVRCAIFRHRPFRLRRRSSRPARPRRELQRRDLEAGEMIPRETQLEAALRANAALRVQAEQLIAAYVAPEVS